MSITVSDFYSATGGGAVKFEVLGDGFGGVIVDAAMVTDEFNVGAEVLKVDVFLEDASADQQTASFYCRSAGQRESVGKAVAAAGGALEIGGFLSVRYTGDKALRSGKSMKIYTAVYRAPQDSEQSESVVSS